MHTPVLGSKLLPPSHLSAHAAAQIRKLTGYHRNAPQLLPWQHTAVTMATPVKNTTGRCDNNGRVILMRGEPRDHIGHPSPPKFPFCHENPFHSVWAHPCGAEIFSLSSPAGVYTGWSRKMKRASVSAVSVLPPLWREWSKLRCFDFPVLNVLSLTCLSNGFASHYTLCLQEWFK